MLAVVARRKANEPLRGERTREHQHFSLCQPRSQCQLRLCRATCVDFYAVGVTFAHRRTDVRKLLRSSPRLRGVRVKVNAATYSRIRMPLALQDGEL